MSIEIITQDDLIKFKSELLLDIRKILTETKSNNKNWLRTKEVMEILSISPGTLQNYRINGSIKFSRLGRTIYYSANDIDDLLSQNNTT